MSNSRIIAFTRNSNWELKVIRTYKLILQIIICFIVFVPGKDGVCESFATTKAKTDVNTVNVKVANDVVAPTKINIKSGTTVVWFNEADSPLKIKFKKRVSTTCKSPRGFVSSSDGIRKSEEISQGDFVSLCFLEPRTFDYEIEFLDGALRESHSKVSGSIAVRKN